MNEKSVLPQCFVCKNYLDDFKCKAFRQGIPNTILTNEFSHAEPFPGDNGIRFDPTEDANEPLN